MIKGDVVAVAESEVPERSGHAVSDLSDEWGFHLFQELRRMEDKADAKFAALDAKFDAKFAALDAKFDAKFMALDAKFDAKFVALDAKFDRKVDTLRYWAIGTVVAVAVATATLMVTLLH